MARGFRKRVKIAKGVHLNVSKSGLGLSVGGKGLSVSTGKRGTYLNTGIPGTGLYSRTKIGGGSGRSNKASKSTGSTYKPQNTSPDSLTTISLGVEDDGDIHFYYQSGEEIVDPELIKQIKRQATYKNALPQLKEMQAEKAEEIRSKSENATADFTELYKHSPLVKPKKTAVLQAENKLKILKPERYTRKTWNIPIPTQEDVRQNLETEALEQFPGLFKKKKRISYVESNLASAMQKANETWKEQKRLFEEQETCKEREENARYEATYDDEVKSIQRCLSDDEDVIVDCVIDWLSNLQLPLEMDADIDFKDDVLFIDLDLPEAEDLPTEYVQILKSGKASTKNKTQKQIKQEYVQCVFGLAEFLASSIFNLNCSLDAVAISGYTQRRNKDGDLNDDYIYSVVIPRNSLENIHIKNPVDTFMTFPNRMKLSAANTFSKIEPFTEDEVIAMISDDRRR